jgi:hypothetical protein
MANKYMKLYSQVIVNKGQHTFYTFSNADGKTWVMPAKNMRIAMNLYQPSSIKGKFMKRFFPFLKSFVPVRKLLHVSVGKYELAGELDELLKTLFKIDRLDFALFGGTPSVHQKITMQISQGNKILGYCKFSDKEEIKSLFSYEQTVLDTLKEKKIELIPECLYCGTFKKDICVFVQSTIKTNRSKVIHDWTNDHWFFLSNLKQKTEHTLLFKETDFYYSIQFLQQNLLYLLPAGQTYLYKAISKVLNHYKDSSVTFSFYHGDFTPWNTSGENGRLFVFDWEYARLTYPAYLDWFHFFTQCCIFERHFQAEKIYKYYMYKKIALTCYMENPDFLYTCYLLHIISFYLERESGYYSGDIKKSMSIWLKLLSFL